MISIYINLDKKLIFYKMKIQVFSIIVLGILNVSAMDYHVGPDKNYLNIGAVPWESLISGDHVFIYWRSDTEGGAYKEKWVINISGTVDNPFTVTGVLGPNGERPVIDGNGATTRSELSYWSEVRGVLKIGGSSIPNNAKASFIIIENLEIRSAHPDYNFANHEGILEKYRNNASSIFIESGNNITIRNCVLHDSGNGLFSAHETSDLLIEENYFYGNGIAGSIYEHNSYTETMNITFQYNNFGPLREGGLGNNLKDRSVGLTVKYNWIKGGNRLLDLVESDFANYYNNPNYRETFVYGNILVEQDGGNPQVIHYGGDNGNKTYYRKGKLYLYNNTLYSIRAANTTLLRLSSKDESADIRNNIFYVTSEGNEFAILDNTGNAILRNNWCKPNWRYTSTGNMSSLVDYDGSNVEGNDPGFMNAAQENYHLKENSSCIDKGTFLNSDVLPEHNITKEYLMHQEYKTRVNIDKIDLGAYEYNDNSLSNHFEESLNKAVLLYPIPVKDTLNIDLQGETIRKGRIYTMNGISVLSFSNLTTLKIDVSGLKNGIYILDLSTSKGTKIVKIIKE